MPNPSFPPEAILRGMTLHERVERLRRLGRPVVAHDAELARRELALWRAQKPFEEGGAFAARLAAEGIDERELARVLGEDTSCATGACTPTPEWARAIESAFARPGEPWSIRMDQAPSDVRTLCFLDALEPPVRAARDELLQRVRALVRARPEAPFEAESAVAVALAPLPWTLHALLVRAMVLEVNVARLRGDLAGATPEARFDAFAAGLRDRERAFAFLVDYPVLARMAHAAIARWKRFSAEFLEHLALDRASLHRVFPELSGARLEGIDAGAGDAHRDGRSVVIASFTGGARLVYKPRSLAVDAHFQELLAWIDAHHDGPRLRRLRVLDRGDHGWVEFVVPAPCASLDAMHRFYRRQGALIAVLFALEAVDFHFENLIASGEDPVLIDLESLFHARFGGDEAEEASLRLVAREIARSVQRIGILPQKVQTTEDHAGLDLSGLAGREGQLTPQRVLQWSDVATDAMHARRERVPMPGAHNLPSLAEARAGEATAVIRFRRDIEQGFAEVYRLFAEHRDELLAPQGPIARFSDDAVRCVLRPTSLYGKLLSEA